jgi:uncharacterized protein YabN with tetrapyrrole methylase and pyrophosphatase domain
MSNTLVIAGVGIRFLSQLTLEVKSAIENCDCVLYLVNEPAYKRWIIENSKQAISLDTEYFSGKSRKDVYQEIEDKILEYCPQYTRICFITYGHPFFLSNSALNIAKKVKKTHQETDIIVMPGISSLDCLFCDLMVDPGDIGIQAYEATDFLLYDRTFDTSSHLVLWQIGVIGIQEVIKDEDILNSPVYHKGISLIQSKLLEKYPSKHPIFFYVAAQYPSQNFTVVETTIDSISKQKIDRLSTAYIPPSSSNEMNSHIREKLLSNL